MPTIEIMIKQSVFANPDDDAKKRVNMNNRFLKRFRIELKSAFIHFLSFSSGRLKLGVVL